MGKRNRLRNRFSIPLSDVSLRQIRAYLAVARTLSFTRAATATNLSQPALTVRIRSLQEQLGIKLFDRNSRSVELTRLGRDLVPVFVAALAQRGNGTDYISDIVLSFAASQRTASANDELLSGNRAGVRREKERDCGCNLIRANEASDRRQSWRHIAARRIIQHRRLGRSRCHNVDGDAARCKLSRERSRHRDQRRLACGVLSPAGGAGCGAAADEDDAAALRQARRKDVGETFRGVDMEPPHRRAVIMIELTESADLEQARGVDQRRRRDVGDRTRDGIDVVQIERQVAIGRIGEGRGPAADTGDSPAVTQQPRDDRGPNAGARARDECVRWLAHDLTRPLRR